jgi:nucleotide-binding universal stress UspA family protein
VAQTDIAAAVTRDGVRRFRRVLVALDSPASSEITLEMAAALAAATTSELRGLFVEDQDLLRLAGLPFAREVQLARAMSRVLVPEDLLRDVRAQAALARAAMEKQALLHRLSWSFQVAQGRSEDAILLAAERGDLIVISRSFGPLSSYGRLGRQARLIAARAPGPLLLPGAQRAGRPGAVLLPYDASPAAEQMLAIASDLALARREPLEIIRLGECTESIDSIAGRLRGSTGERGVPELRLWTPRDLTAVLRRLCEVDRGLLLLPADAPCFDSAQIERIVERARVPIVIAAGGASLPA